MAISKIPILSATTWQDLPRGDASSYDKYTLHIAVYNKVGSIVFLNLYNNGAITSGWKNIGKLPEGFRPSGQIHSSGGGRDGKTYEIQIQTNGNVFLNSNTSISWVSTTVSFAVG